jgi:hypothetical protein
MSTLKFEVDVEKLTESLGALQKEATQVLEMAVKSASVMTHAKAQELAAQQLKTRHKTYKDNLVYREVAPGLWVVELLEPAMWIEEGRPEGSMVDDLLRKNPKIAKDGTRYKSIPFDQTREVNSKTNPQNNVVKTMLQNFLKESKIPLTKIEKNSDGSPKLGTLHKLNIKSPYPSPTASHQALWGVNIIQRMVNGKVKRDILTFRTVSDKSKAEGKFYYPGLEGVKILDQSYDWITKTWESEILPSLMRQFE